MPIEHVVCPQAQVADDLMARQRIDIGVQIGHLHPQLLIILRELLGHALGEGGHQHALPPLHALTDLFKQVIDLAAHRPHAELGVHQAGGPDDLLHDAAFCTRRNS